MTEEPLSRLIWELAVPTVITMLVTAAYNMADTFFVGRIGTEATAGVGLILPVMAIIQAIVFFFGQGSGNFISRSLGARDFSHAERMAATGGICAALFGLVLLAAGVVFRGGLLALLGARDGLVDAATIGYASDYLTFILCGAPFMCLSCVLNNQLRFQGNAAYAMWGILSGVVLNLILAPLLILYFCLGITGAAIATLVSQIFGCAMLLLMSTRGQNIRISLHNFAPRWAFIKEIIFGGTPSLSRQGLGSLSAIMLNVAAGQYGDAAIAGMSIVTRLSFFIYAVVIGLGQGFQPLCGFCYGARLYGRIRQAFYFCIKCGTVFLSVCAIIGYVFSEPIIELFRSDPAVIAVGAVALDWQIISYPLVATIVMTNMLTQTIRKPVRANLVAAARSGLFFIPLILILPRFFGLLGVEMCQAWADVCSFALSVPVAWSAFRDMRRNSPSYN